MVLGKNDSPGDTAFLDKWFPFFKNQEIKWYTCTLGVGFGVPARVPTPLYFRFIGIENCGLGTDVNVFFCFSQWGGLWGKDDMGGYMFISFSESKRSAYEWTVLDIAYL